MLYKKYSQAFDSSYCEECPIDVMLNDLTYLEKISADNFIELDFYLSPEKHGNALHLRIYKWEELIPLSDILPILSDLDFRAWSERTYRVRTEKGLIWISDFAISYSRGSEFHFDKTRQLLRDAFTEICSGHFESDGFNKLILGALLSWREITMIRAYAKYLKQAGFRFSQLYIEQALANNAELVKHLVELFNVHFNPQQKLAHKNQAAQIEEKISARSGASKQSR